MKYLLFILSWILLNQAKGQDYSFKHYKAENGLSYNSVFCSLQDSKGFMWFGTLDGLNRFDGYNFKVFRNIPSNYKSIGNNVISALHEDKKGNIWVGTHNGLYCYNPITEDFVLVMPTYSKWIGSITSDNSGNLWLISGGNLCRYNHISKNFTVLVPTEVQTATLITNRDGEIWFGSNWMVHLRSFRSLGCWLRQRHKWERMDKPGRERCVRCGRRAFSYHL
ncbi:MAG: hypothetical protein EOP51_32140 [Sphingobacteriales bacterium]|nr:MAG: hypothetical protein EOP51_32140 [Sphingobacteriales bacterium]